MILDQGHISDVHRRLHIIAIGDFGSAACAQRMGIPRGPYAAPMATRFTGATHNLPFPHPLCSPTVTVARHRQGGRACLASLQTPAATDSDSGHREDGAWSYPREPLWHTETAYAQSLHLGPHS